MSKGKQQVPATKQKRQAGNQFKRVQPNHQKDSSLEFGELVFDEPQDTFFWREQHGEDREMDVSLIRPQK